MAMSTHKLAGWILLAAVSGSLVACSSEPTADLELYVQEVKNRQVSKIEPLPEFKPYESFTYMASDLRDPFTEPAFSHPQAVATRASGNGIKPDFDLRPANRATGGVPA